MTPLVLCGENDPRATFVIQDTLDGSLRLGVDEPLNKLSSWNYVMMRETRDALLGAVLGGDCAKRPGLATAVAAKPPSVLMRSRREMPVMVESLPRTPSCLILQGLKTRAFETR